MKVLIAIVLFIASAHSVTIECDFRMLESCYSCYRPTVNISDNNSALTRVTGRHLSGKNNAAVGCLNFILIRTIDWIPTGMETFFPNLVQFQWTSGILRTISSQDLKPFPNLTSVILSHNNFSSLDGDLFQHTTGLTAIYFDKTGIEHVGIGFLTNLNNLRYATIENNPCINIFANTPEAIRELKEQISVLCPPLQIVTDEPETIAPTTEVDTTVEAGECPAECDEQFKTMKNELSHNATKNDELSEKVSHLEKLIEKYEERIAALEDRIFK